MVPGANKDSNYNLKYNKKKCMVRPSYFYLLSQGLQSRRLNFQVILEVTTDMIYVDNASF